MAVPDLDERDGEFAHTLELPIVETKLLPVDDAVLQSEGSRKVQYRLQDWVFSRQRYWGEPIPIVHCPKDGAVAVPDSELPIRLPDVEHYEPSGTGESPLATFDAWVNTTCPTCGGQATRETNTMPQWAGSSWYYLRYMDPANDVSLVAPEKEKYWAPVDLYVGGAEHATRHLIYARFWHKFLYDIGAVTTLEPFTELHSVGLILAEDGRKMSKRWGNVVNPDDIVETFGADSMRVYEMFMGPFNNAIAWSTNGLVGARRFIERVHRTAEYVAPESVPELERALNITIQKVGNDIAEFKFNTAISQMMILQNEIDAVKKIGTEQYGAYLKLLAPFAPHVTEELWHSLGHTASIHLEPWPIFDPTKLVSDTVMVAFQVAGKTRGAVEVPRDASQEAVIAELKKDEKMAKHMPETPSRVIFVPNKILNLIP
jgi:leucyl-tRNA synthetase